GLWCRTGPSWCGAFACGGPVRRRPRRPWLAETAAPSAAELPLRVQLVSVAVPGTADPVWSKPPLHRPPPKARSLGSVVVTELLLMVQLVSVAVPELDRPPPLTKVRPMAALDSVTVTELPLMVQLLSVAVPELDRPPP